MRVTTFGEIMLRLTTPTNQTFIQANSFEANYGGAEANVAVSLSQLGDQTSLITKLPANELGDGVIRQLTGFGVDTHQISCGGERLGLYFLQRGAGIRPSNVIYDRSNSAFALSDDQDYPWPELLGQTDYFYISGITPALSPNLQETLLNAVKFCRQADIPVVYDANYRGKLWSPGAAQQFTKRIMPFVTICLVHDEDLLPSFNIKTTNSNHGLAIDQKDTFKRAMTAIMAQYPNCQAIASILRNQYSPQKSSWTSLLLHDRQFYQSPVYQMTTVPEVAAGDAFGAGIIHGFLNHFNDSQKLNYAMAAAAWKLTIPGDFNLATNNDIMRVLKNSDQSIRR